VREEQPRRVQRHLPRQRAVKLGFDRRVRRWNQQTDARHFCGAPDVNPHGYEQRSSMSAAGESFQFDSRRLDHLRPNRGLLPDLRRELTGAFHNHFQALPRDLLFDIR